MKAPKRDITTILKYVEGEKGTSAGNDDMLKGKAFYRILNEIVRTVTERTPMGCW